MKKLYTYLPLLLLTAILVSCSGSKRMFKRGQEFEDAGLYEEAATSYMDALRRDDDNIEALIALREVGQIVVDNKYADFFSAVQNGEDKEAIRYYKEAEDFRSALRRYNIDIARPSGHEEDFQLALARYLEIQYQAGRDALGRKEYETAQGIFEEILSLKDEYKDSENLLRIATARPMYAEAMEAFDNREYRSAYRILDNLENEVGEFDQSAHYKAIALRNGQFGLGIMEFENHTDFGGVESLLSSKITRNLQAKNDPFLKLIDRTMLSRLTDEQIRAMSGQSDPVTAAETGQLLGAKAILVGELVSMSVEKSNLRRTRRPGYLGRRVTRTNSEGERYTTMIYDKVWYYDVEQSLKVSAILQFKLVSVETGEILLTDAITVSESDEIQYSTYNGETRYLYMGEWTNINSPQAGDRRLGDSRSKRQLDDRLKARQSLRSEEEMKEELYADLSQRVADQIYQTFLQIED
ncbi:MAG: hypothetical protein HWE14_13910 [Flavobacteriia bacterium]|nr:hypothetical protein [Flavobacteriia bacterium]